MPGGMRKANGPKGTDHHLFQWGHHPTKHSIMSNIDPSKFIFNLSIADFIEVMKYYFPSLANERPLDAASIEDGPTFTGRLIYGVTDICKFFKISRKCYYNWLPWLKDAIKQNGRKPILDVEYALKLYDRNKKKDDTDSED